MYEDLADAVESFKEKGFTHTFEIEGNKLICNDLDLCYYPDDVKIIESYRHERMTDPGTDSTVFALKSSTGVKGILITGYRMYVDQDKAKLIDKLMQTQEKTQ